MRLCVCTLSLFLSLFKYIYIYIYTCVYICVCLCENVLYLFFSHFLSIYIYIYIYICWRIYSFTSSHKIEDYWNMYLPNLCARAGCDTRSVFKETINSFELCFLFSRLVVIPRLNSLVFPTIYPKLEGKCIPFLALHKMQTAQARFRAQVAVSISFDDKHCNKNISLWNVLKWGAIYIHYLKIFLHTLTQSLYTSTTAKFSRYGRFKSQSVFLITTYIYIYIYICVCVYVVVCVCVCVLHVTNVICFIYNKRVFNTNDRASCRRRHNGALWQSLAGNGDLWSDHHKDEKLSVTKRHDAVSSYTISTYIYMCVCVCVCMRACVCEHARVRTL